MSSSWSDHLTLKLLNVAAFALFFSSSLYSSLSGHYANGRETFFTPSEYSLSLWGLVNLLFGGYVIYQFFDSSHDAIHGVGYRFIAIGVLNSIFIHTFASGHFIVAFIFSILVASNISYVYYSLRAHYPSKSIGDYLFVHLPFSLAHAYSLVAIILSAFALFTPTIHAPETAHPGFTVRVLVMLAEAFLAMTAYGYCFQSQKGDVAGASVIALVLYGIYDHQHNHFIRDFALGSFIVTLFAIVKSVFFTLRSDDQSITLRNDPERAPLIG